MPVRVIWPDGPREIPENEIISLAQDSWANHCDWFRCDQCGQNVNTEGCLHNGTWTPVFEEGQGPEKPRTIEDAMAWLTDTGEMTFGR